MEAWIPILLSVLGSGGLAMFVLSGIGKWYARRQELRTADKAADLKKIDDLTKQIFEMQQARITEEIKRREAADDGTKVLSEMTVLLKNALAAKGQMP